MMNAVDKLKQRSRGAGFVANIIHHIYDTYCVHQTKGVLKHHQSSRSRHKDGGEGDSETVIHVLHVIHDALSKGAACQVS